jgi:hypothetical protein
MAPSTPMAAAVSAAAMTAASRAMTAASRAMAAAVAWAMSRRSVDVDVPIDVNVPIHMDIPIDMEVAVIPTVPAGAATPANPAIPRKATPVPAWATPARSVPAVIPTAPNELRLFDGRAFDERGPRRECANVHRRLSRQDELGDHSGRRSER